MRVMTIFGTRPEVMKLAPIIHALERQDRGVASVVCSTGQHREMLGPLCQFLGIKPDIELDVMTRNQTLEDLTGRLVAALGSVVREVRPNWIVAQGDTTTVFVAALVAFYQKIGFAHVEAGLRTGDLRQPFPEEMNRRFADMVADLHFAPTELARQRLLNEGVPAARIHVTGNTIVDTLTQVAALPYDWSIAPFRELSECDRLVLVTAHRRESFGNPLRELCHAIRELAECFAPRDVTFVFPVHPNPSVQGPVHEILGEISNIRLLRPLDYLSLINLLRRATLVITDSGGIQEEAPSFGIPLLVARERTERPEGVSMGVAKLVGTTRDRIVAEASRLLTDPKAHAAMVKRVNPYGDGRAAQRIVAALLDGTGIGELRDRSALRAGARGALVAMNPIALEA